MKFKNDVDLLGYAEAMTSESEANKSELSAEMQSNKDFFYGKHWKNQKRENPRPVTNYCFSTVRTQVALLTDNRPRIACNPVEPADNYKADVIKKGVSSLWDYNRCDRLLQTTLYPTLITGTGFWKVLWDANRTGICGKKGEIITVNIPAENIFPPADATGIHNCSYLSQVSYMPLYEIKRKYGDVADKLKPEAMPLKREPVTGTVEPSQTLYKDTTGQYTYLADSSNKLAIGGQSCKVVEFWYWNEDLDDYSIVIYCNKTILKKLDNPLKNKKLPFVPFYNYWLGDSFWGLSEISLIKPLQRDLNIMKTVIYDHIRLVGNSPWIVGMGADLEVSNMENGEGLIYSVTDVNQLRRDAPPPMPADVFKTLADIKYEIDTLTATFDVTQGRRPIGITAGVAINELQEAAQVPIRSKARVIQDSLIEVGRLWLDAMRKHYNEERIKYLTKDISEELKNNKVDLKDIDGEYDLRFDIESSLGQTRGAKTQQAIELYAAGIVDRRAVMDAIDFPNREDIIKRMGIADAINKMLASGQMPGMEQAGMQGQPANIPAGVAGAETPPVTEAPAELQGQGV